MRRSSVSIGSNSLLITESRAMMNYNALQATLRQRLTHGLEFTVNYTYSKAMTNSLGNYSLKSTDTAERSRTITTAPPITVRPATTQPITCHSPACTRCPWAVGRSSFPMRIVSWMKSSADGRFPLSACMVRIPRDDYRPWQNSNSYGTSRANQYRKLKIVNRNIPNGDQSKWELVWH